MVLGVGARRVPGGLARGGQCAGLQAVGPARVVAGSLGLSQRVAREPRVLRSPVPQGLGQGAARSPAFHLLLLLLLLCSRPAGSLPPAPATW